MRVRFHVLVVLAILGSLGAVGQSPTTQPTLDADLTDALTFGSFEWGIRTKAANSFRLHVAVARVEGARSAASQEFASRLLETLARRVPAGLQRQYMCAFERLQRAIYADIYPWASESGELFIAIALFTDDDPVTPFFTNDTSLLSDSTAAIDSLVDRATDTILANVSEKFATGWPDPLQPSIPTSQCGSNPNDVVATSRPADATRFQLWRIAPNIAGDKPPLRFRFAPPIDEYSGIVREFEGEYRSDGSSLLTIAARVNSIDMGETDLTESINSDVHLDTHQFPTARFDFCRAEGMTWIFAPGPRPITLVGTFEMKGQRIPLFARATQALATAADGSVRLRLRGSFRINIEPFGLFPPSGPAPANRTMIMEFDFVFQPAK